MDSNKLGGLVEVLNYVFVYDEGTSLYTVFCASYPEEQVTGKNKEKILAALQDRLSYLEM